MSFPRPAYAAETYDPNGLFGGDFPRRGAVITVADSAALTAGAVLGMVTANGKFLLSASGASDGSQTPIAILAEDVDASGGDATGVAYFSGDFLKDALSFGAGHDADSVEASLRVTGHPIFLTSRTPK